ncbi:MAG: hypothetical protein ACYDGN_05855 [Acidimicrobiales bacterium]
MSTPQAFQQQRRSGGPSLRPAMIILAVAVFIVLGGTVLALVGGSTARPGTSTGIASAVPGSRLRAQGARTFLAHISSQGEPPANIVDALAVPAGSRYLGRFNADRGVSQFDRKVKFSVAAPESEVRTFYLKFLSQQKWVLESLSARSANSTEIIAQRSGTDGYEWRVGLIATSTSPLISPALAGGGPAAPETTVTMALYQVGEAS